MKLKSQYQTLDEIPEQYRDLYEERGGVYVLTQIEGMKTEADVSRVKRALDQEKEDHKQTKSQLSDLVGDEEVEDVQKRLDRLEELEATAGEKIDDEKIDDLVEKRMRAKIAPVERERDKYKKQVEEQESKIGEYEAKDRQRTIHDEVRKAAQGTKVHDTAMDDALMLAENVFEVDDDGRVVTKDKVGVTPGLEPSAWLSEMQEKRPHWWPESSGGGAGGSNGAGKSMSDNPWTKSNWNLTKQAQYEREHGTDKAEQMAKAAGSSLEAVEPPE